MNFVGKLVPRDNAGKALAVAGSAVMLYDLSVAVAKRNPMYFGLAAAAGLATMKMSSAYKNSEGYQV